MGRRSSGGGHECGKKAYATRAAAESALRLVAAENGDWTMHVYLCGACGNFHFGRPRSNKAKRKLNYTNLIDAIERANGKEHK
jgi:hypothetical protein